MQKNLQLHLTRLLTLATLLLGINMSFGQYSGTGTFTKIAALSDLTDGYYVIAYGTTFAMNNTNSSGFFANTAITPSGTNLTNPAAAIVWKITTDGTGKTIYNEASATYVSYTGASNAAQATTTATTNNQRWSVTYTASTFVFTNAAVTDRELQYNTSAPRFACYTGSQKDLTLYKMAAPTVVVPTVTTTTASAITTSSFNTGGSATNGNGTLSAKGIVYSATATTPIITNATVTNSGTAAGSFTTSITGLASNTRYYYRAYATNSAGTSYGPSVLSAYTLANTPSVPVVSGITSSTIDVAIGENANNAATRYVIRVNGNTYVDASGALTASETPLASPAGSGTPITVKGLASNTDYTFEVKAINSNNVSTAYSTFVKGTTLLSTAPVLTLTSSDLAFTTICTNTSLTKSFVFSGANLEANASVVVFPVDGYTYSTTENGTFKSTLTITNYNGGDVTVWVKFTPTVVQSYNGTISLAAPGGAALSVPATGQAINTPATVVTGAASGITGLAATLAGSITANGCSDVTAYGIEYSLTNNFTAGTGTQVAATNLNSGSYSAAIGNLSPGTTYYYIAYATNAGGTVYSTQQLFTTLAVEAPVTTAATTINQTSFTANWTAVTSATGYRLDVSTNPAFSTTVPAKTIVDSFDGITSDKAISSYGTATWTDSNNIVWTSYNTRLDTSVIDGDSKSIGFNSTGNPYFISNEITGGLSNIKFDLKQVFSGTGGILTITALTGTNFDTETVIGTQSYTQNVLATYDSGPITGITGSYKIRVSSNNIRVAIDNLSYTTAPSTTTFFVAGYNNLDVKNVTSYNVTGIIPYTTYYYRVRAYSANSTSVNSNTTSVTTKTDVVTWAIPSGKTEASWLPTEYPDGTPVVMDTNVGAIIAADYNTKTNGLFVAKNITMQSGTFTVATGTTLTVNGGIINKTGAAKFVVENNAAILQNTATSNTGAITIAKSTNPLYRLDYTMWSAPVSGLKLRDFSPVTTPTRFYEYKYDLDAASGENIESYFTIDPSNLFTPAKSYLIRMPNTSIVDGYDAGDVPLAFNGKFTGTANNGTITIPLSTVGNNFTAIGNPYASPVSIAEFFSSNAGNIDTTSGIYMWRKKNDATTSSYATLNLTAYVANNAAGGGDDQKDFFTGDSDSWILGVGQGFFVKSAKDNPNPVATFTNSMRRAAPESGSQPVLKPGTIPASHLWLNITTTNKDFSQTAIAYIDGATKNLDYGYDATRFTSDQSVSIFSLAGDSKLAIQARPAFDATDVVPVGFVANNAGTYTITLDRADGLFTTSQDIYIKDNLLGLTKNIKEGAYTFTTEKGTFTNRFEIVYTKTTLGIANPELDANSIMVYKQGDVININSGTAVINGVTVYDIRGQKLYNRNAINVTQATINGLTAQQQVLIIEVNTVKGKVSKKIIF